MKIIFDLDITGREYREWERKSWELLSPDEQENMSKLVLKTRAALIEKDIRNEDLSFFDVRSLLFRIGLQDTAKGLLNADD